MRRIGGRPARAAILIVIALSFSCLSALAADSLGPKSLPFPKPSLLEPNVEFWKQIYTEYGVGDFVLHDRDRLGLVYGVVRVGDTTNQARAADLARSEIQRLRAKYQDILSKLAAGVPPEELGPDGAAVYQAWGCPCAKDVLLRAADNIRVQQGLRQKVDEGLQRAQKLLPRILAILREHNVPVELAALPMVESSYNPQAYSKAGAAGLWQFIRSTGKQYLTITRKRDDRRDPIRATEAAAHLLRHNYEALGSWPLAIVAYNHGREGIRAAQVAVGSSAIEDIIAGYVGPRFGFASKNFYAEFLAALDVVHPFIDGRGKPLEAKGRQRGVKQVALGVQRQSVTTITLPAPPVAATPSEAGRPTEAFVPSTNEALIQQSVIPEPVSSTADLPAPPSPSAPIETEHPTEALVPSSDQSTTVQPETPEPTSVIPDLSASPADISTEVSAVAPPIAGESTQDVPSPEVREAESSEPAAP
jgi:hypothetical protein